MLKISGMKLNILIILNNFIDSVNNKKKTKK
jgi:hypothetical protein